MREISATVAGITIGARLPLLKKHCHVKAAVELAREPANTHDPNAIAVYLLSSGLFGLGKRRDQIGYIKAGTAKHMAPKLDRGVMKIQRGYVQSFYLPQDADDDRLPYVSLCLEVVD